MATTSTGTPAGTPPWPEKIGRYQILGELGRGAMGRVYRAFDPNIGRHIALKAIPLDNTDPEMVRRFRLEAQAAGILSHPNIVTIYDAGQDNGFLYIAMELVNGPTLQEMLAGGPLPLSQAIALSEQAAGALDHAHASGIIHRDIKPANIMVQGKTVKVADFGVAKLGSAAMTSTGQLLGTPQYLAPEVIKGAPADARSDLFAFGAVLYEMLTGRHAFAGDSITNVIYRIMSEQPTAPSEVLSSLPPGVNFATLKALAKEPADRYGSCGELLADLKNYSALEAQGTALAAPSPPPPPPFPAMLDQTVRLSRESATPAQVLSPAAAVSKPARSLVSWAIAAAFPMLLVAGMLWWRASAGSEAGPEAGPDRALTAAGPAAAMTAESSAPEAPPAAQRPSSSATPVSMGPADSNTGKPSAFGSDTPSTEAASGGPAAPPPAANLGRVVIHTEPAGARILINGDATSYVTPVNIALAAGSYRITIQQEGFESETRDILVESNRAVETRLELRRSGGLLRRIPFLGR